MSDKSDMDRFVRNVRQTATAQELVVALNQYAEKVSRMGPVKLAAEAVILENRWTK